MDRNNGRYPYIRRQGSVHSNYHYNHNNNNANSTTAAAAGSTNATQYSNHSINTSPSSVGMTGNALYAPAVPPSQNVPISQHDELIRYIRGAWNKVYEQGTPVIYCSESDNQLKNFKPFNLEEYWGQRLVQNIHVTTTNASGHQ